MATFLLVYRRNHPGPGAAGGPLEITEEKIWQIVSETQRLLGPEASADMVRKVAREVVRRLQSEQGGGATRDRIICVVAIRPHAPGSTVGLDYLLDGIGATVVRRTETSYAGLCVEVVLLRTSASTQQFKALLRQRLPDGWHALVHPLETVR